MSNSLPRDGHGECWREVESVVRAARHYVQPSEDLRPRTIEAAREYCDDRRAQQRLGGFVLAVLLLFTIGSPAADYLELLRSHASAPSVSEIHARAIEFGSQRHIGSNWGMTEAFTQLRRAQASRLGQAINDVR